MSRPPDKGKSANFPIRDSYLWGFLSLSVSKNMFYESLGHAIQQQKLFSTP